MARSALREVADNLNPFLWYTHQKAAKIFVISDELIREKHRHKTNVLPAVAIDLDPIAHTLSRRPASPARKFYWAGNFIYWKGPELAIRAFLCAKEQEKGLELHMFGDGADYPHLSAKYATVENLFFHGRVSQAALFKQIEAMDAFLYPSFEGGGMVVLEAMARGKPVVGVNYGGLSQMVDEHSGILIPFSDTVSTSRNLGDAILELTTRPAMFSKLSDGARSRASKFSISAKCAEIERHGYENYL
ncbi:glycosyltransferase family 4 protein [Sphingomicrobium astaxanthinifaciens]|uniref:glycosyltransferase family 4 protein n=1 Tax=Sphingomicrobium astaxanthinifaciens TaxID=1227949 RepID=UPI001FCAB028|nr:glycosyltransferase family 4 protein [Sphingomicrobium astaxanthinifaciens]MCJ7420410.1 glycosyltransferase family 4 protein [Sphingomicrobium astaxanthinifaciens]